MTDYSGKKFADFKLMRRISEDGGTAQVYEGALTVSGERKGLRVAVKVARNNHENEYVNEQLLVEETELLIHLHHPGIVRLAPIEIGGKRLWYARERVNTQDHPWYFAMELLSCSLSTVYKEIVRYPMRWRLELIYQISIILDYLDVRSVAHRDLKLDNIMFRVKPDNKQIPIPVLIDFGLAKKRQMENQNNGINAMTVAYAPPELVSTLREGRNGAMQSVIFQKVDHAACDIWSCGIIAYQLLNGRHPYDSINVSWTVLANRIINERPKAMNGDVPAKLQTLIWAMLEKNPKDRPIIEQVVTAFETVSEYPSPRI